MARRRPVEAPLAPKVRVFRREAWWPAHVGHPALSPGPLTHRPFAVLRPLLERLRAQGVA